MADYSYIGVGKVYLKEVGASAGLIHVGNVSALAFNVNEDVRELRDYTQPGGGTYNEVRRIESVEASATMHDLNAANLAKAVFGASTAITAGAITDEAHTAYLGAIVPTLFPIDTTQTVTVTNSDGMTTYVANTDYVVRGGGIEILSGGDITDAQAILVDYTKKAGSAVEALVNSAKEYELFFDGLNEARSGKTVRVTAHRWKMGAAQNLNFIGEDYLAMEVTGRLMKDTSKNGTTVSQYFKVEIVD